MNIVNKNGLKNNILEGDYMKRRISGKKVVGKVRKRTGLSRRQATVIAREMEKSLWRGMDADLSGASEHFEGIWAEAMKRGFEPKNLWEALAFAGKTPAEAGKEFAAWAEMHGTRLEPDAIKLFLKQSYYPALEKLRREKRKR